VEHLFRLFRLQVPEERMDGCEAMVHRRLPTASPGLQVLEEISYEIGIDLLDLESFRRNPPLIAAVPKKEHEDVAVGLHGVGARVPLGRKVCDEVVVEPRRQVRRLHG